jgi:hypothetical protein
MGQTTRKLARWLLINFRSCGNHVLPTWSIWCWRQLENLWSTRPWFRHEEEFVGGYTTTISCMQWWGLLLEVSLLNEMQLILARTTCSWITCIIEGTSSWHGWLHLVSWRVVSRTRMWEGSPTLAFLVRHGGRPCTSFQWEWNHCKPFFTLLIRTRFQTWVRFSWGSLWWRVNMKVCCKHIPLT